MQKFENKPIIYARYKQNSSDKPVCLSGKYQIKRTVKTKGYDDVLHRWDTVNVETVYVPMSEVGAFKEINQVIYVKRTNVNPQTLRNMELWVKVIRKVSVIDKDNNIFLTQADNRIFQTDLEVTGPLNFNYTPQGLKIQKVSEEPLTKIELQRISEDLSNPKCRAKPVICEELQNGELRLTV